jgi:hypothetical protein
MFIEINALQGFLVTMVINRLFVTGQNLCYVYLSIRFLSFPSYWKILGCYDVLEWAYSL